VLLDADGSKKIGKAGSATDEGSRMPRRVLPREVVRQPRGLNDRDHRKLVVIDGREAFVGGHCIVDTWLGNAEDHKHNADVSVQVAWPDREQRAVRIQRKLGRTDRRDVRRQRCFPDAEAGGDVLIHAAFVKPRARRRPSRSCITR
jgi:cardiolipin synthase